MTICKKKGCKNIVSNNEKYCDYHKQEMIQNGIKGAEILAVGGVAARYVIKNKDTIIKCGKFVAKNGTALAKVLMKKF